MTELNVLLVSPNAPPKNTAESIQVRRILAELDKRVAGTLVTVSSTGSWSKQDASLELPLNHFDIQLLDLPFHRLTSRVLMSHYMARFHLPDAMFWITFLASRVIAKLKTRPNIIYSRSCPLSAALLASKIQRKLNIPWVMHLSDPWAENPHGITHPQHVKDEARCFHQASLTTLTTEGQADYYKKKYPDFAHKIIVSPNMMADEKETRAWVNPTQKPNNDERLILVYAGSLYGSRSPESLVQALEILRTTQPDILKKLRIDFYGNAHEECLQMLRRVPEVINYHGAVSFSKAYAALASADLALALDADMENPLCKTFLSCKITDFLALQKPMFAITPDGSEHERICNEGYGWSAPSSRPKEIAQRLAELVEKLPQLRAAAPKAPPEFYKAANVAETLVKQMRMLVSKAHE